MSIHPVIIFHGIGVPQRALEAGEDVFWMSPALFCQTLDQIVEMGAAGPLITFDDGNASDLEIALPELQARDLTATFFLLTQRLDTPGSLTSDDVATLSRAGHGIGLHGHAHVDWRRLQPEARVREFETARTVLAEKVGQTVTTAAAPFGLYDRQVAQDLRARGFQALYTSDRGMADDTAFLRPRNCLEGTMTKAQIQEALRGHVRPMRRARRLFGIARKRLLPLRTER